jgi:hypothetical protein
MVYDAVSRAIPPLFGRDVSKIKLIGQSHSHDSPAPAFKLKQCNQIRKLVARLGIATTRNPESHLATKMALTV